MENDKNRKKYQNYWFDNFNEVQKNIKKLYD